MPRGEDLAKSWSGCSKSIRFEDAEDETRSKTCAKRFRTILWRIGALKSVPRQMGVALHHFARAILFLTPSPRLRRKFSPKLSSRNMRSIPMYVGRRSSIFWPPIETTSRFEDEWLSSGHDAYDFRTVICDRDSIIAAISRERGRSASTTVATNEET